MSQIIDLKDLPKPVAEAIENLVRSYREQTPSSSEVRQTGWARGILPDLPQSFFEPLPDSVLGLFEDKPA